MRCAAFFSLALLMLRGTWFPGNEIGIPVRPNKENEGSMRGIRLLVPLALMLSAPAMAVAAEPVAVLNKAQLERIREIIDESCVFCHGERGEASNPIYPRLAAQNREYLARQLRLFRSGARKSDIMNEQAGDLKDAEIEALATYFSAQPPLSHKLAEDEWERQLWEVGRYVFRYGDPFENIPPCMTCHGKDARGGRTLPRLAGQHRKYIVNQLLAFQSGKRKTDDAMMRSIAKNLSRLAMEGVALYLSTLKPENSASRN